jgi:prepilin-type N-terminal cleavage/methylation domain-containing protein
MQQHRKGFTLIELLVVISIIAILAVIVFTQVQGLTGRARNTTTQSLVREGGNSINLYRNDETVGDAVVLVGATADAQAAFTDASAATADTNAADDGMMKLSVTTGDTGFGPFTGTLSATAFTYPTRITRVPSASHIITYRVLSADATVNNTATAANANYAIPTGGCVQVIGQLVGASGSTTASFYRNGVVSTTAVANPGLATNLTCSN